MPVPRGDSEGYTLSEVKNRGNEKTHCPSPYLPPAHLSCFLSPYGASSLKTPRCQCPFLLHIPTHLAFLTQEIHTLEYNPRGELSTFSLVVNTKTQTQILLGTPKSRVTDAHTHLLSLERHHTTVVKMLECWVSNSLAMWL